MEPPKMPEKYKGEELNKTEYTKTVPRKWTDKEIEWCLKLNDEGYSYSEIADSVERSNTSVSIKMKRLKKASGDYNAPHVEDKYQANKKFLEYIQPDTILDAYAGDCYYDQFDIETTTNDINEDKPTDYHLDAHKFLCKLYAENNKFDLVDLDPFGSAYDCFDLGIKMAKKGLIITLGEIGHKRFKRLDFVKRYYQINDLENFTTRNLIKHIQYIGRRNKKELNPVFVKEWNMILRVYFEIERHKVTEQWD